jgi:anti-repressor protein
MARDPLLEGRIAQYGFVEGRDYVTIDQELLIGGKRRMVKDYYGTLSMGKELAMVENNDRDRMIRRCDK